MAKSTRSRSRQSATTLETSTAAVRSWLTAAERKLLDGTLGRTLAEASQKQVQATLARARGLRDKWRDLFNRQMQSAKRTSRRGDSVNTRSLDKSELFAAAVRRLEARIQEFVTGGSAPVRGPGGKTSRPAKVVRTAGHRGSRATVRKALSKAVAATTPAVRPGAAATATTEADAGPAAETRGAATSRKARQAGKRKSLAVAGAGQAFGFDPRKQRSAKASATRTRLKLDGLSTRRRGHTLAAGKRKQARRDGR